VVTASLAASGPYRVRAHAAGRDTDPDGVAFEPFETYRLVIWPEVNDTETVYKQTDRFGAEQRDLARAN
jgi:hypothetical protein